MRARLLLGVLSALAVLAVSLLAVTGGVARASATDYPTHLTGRWIEVDTDNGLIKAVDNGEIVYETYATVGTARHPTPQGYFEITNRIVNETMDSSTYGLPVDAPGGYYLPDVLYTQYFDEEDGIAIHYNYWSPEEDFGTGAGSHGCVGLMLGDARYFWNFADIGTPVIIY